MRVFLKLTLGWAHAIFWPELRPCTRNKCMQYFKVLCCVHFKVLFWLLFSVGILMCMEGKAYPVVGTQSNDRKFSPAIKNNCLSSWNSKAFLTALFFGMWKMENSFHGQRPLISCQKNWGLFSIKLCLGKINWNLKLPAEFLLIPPPQECRMQLLK